MPVTVLPAMEYFPRAFQWQAGTGTDERIGLMGTLVWEPNDKMKAQVDYFRSEFDRDDQRTGLTASGFREAAAANNNVTGQVINNGVVTSATISPINPNIASGGRDHAWFEARTEDQTTNADSDTYGIILEWYPTDSSTLVFDAYRSEGDKTREDRIATMHAYQLDFNGPGTFQEVPGQSMTYQLNGAGFASADFSGVDFTDLNTMRLGRYERYPHEYTDQIDAFKVDFKQDLDWGWVSGLEAGVRISDREFTTDRGTFQYGGREGIFDTGTESWCEANDTETGANPLDCAPQPVDGFVRVQSLPGVPDHFAITDIASARELHLRRRQRCRARQVRGQLDVHQRHHVDRGDRRGLPDVQLGLHPRQHAGARQYRRSLRGVGREVGRPARPRCG